MKLNLSEHFGSLSHENRPVHDIYWGNQLSGVHSSAEYIAFMRSWIQLNLFTQKNNNKIKISKQ